MVAGVMHTIIGTKFQINPSPVTLFSGSGPKNPVAGEFSKCRMLYRVNFCLRHNVPCFSIILALYSMYSFNAIIAVVLLDERGCHV